MSVLAAAGSSNPVDIIASAGVAGAVVLLFVAGKLHPDSTVKALRADLADAREQIRKKDEQLAAHAQKLIETVIPAVTEATVAVERITPLLEDRPARRRAGGL